VFHCKNDVLFWHQDRQKKEDNVDTQFFFGLALVVCVFVLCFLFKKENMKRD